MQRLVFRSFVLLGILPLFGFGCGGDSNSANGDPDGGVDALADGGTQTTGDGGASDAGTTDVGGLVPGLEPIGQRRIPSTLLSVMDLQCDGACNIAINGARVVAGGKILVFGTQGGNWHIFRLNATGDAIDPSFGDNGVLVVESTGLLALQYAFALDAQERIVLMRRNPGVDSGTLNTYYVSRYDSDGVLDQSFGTDGSFGLAGALSVNFSGSQLDALAVLPDGRILLGGSSNTDGTNNPRQWLLTALTPAGAHDGSVNGGQGYITLSPRPDATTRSSRYQIFSRPFIHGGAVYLSGIAGDGDEAVVGRLKADLSLDTAFGDAGYLAFGAGADVAINDMLVDGQGRLVLAGTGPGATGSIHHAPSGLAYHVRRYLSDGTPDASFGEGGQVVIDLATTSMTTIFDDIPSQVQLTAAGNLLVTGVTHGRTGTPPDRRISMARLFGNGALDPGFRFTENRLSVNTTGERIHLNEGVSSRLHASDWPRVAVVQLTNGSLLGIAPRPRYSTANNIQASINPDTPIMLQFWD